MMCIVSTHQKVRFPKMIHQNHCYIHWIFCHHKLIQSPQFEYNLAQMLEQMLEQVLKQMLERIQAQADRNIKRFGLLDVEAAS